MNKEDLINAVAKSTCTKAEAAKAVDAVLGAIKKSLKKGETVTLVGFGTFKVAKRSARNGRNPQTGKPIKIAAKKVPKFTAGKAFKRCGEVNKKCKSNNSQIVNCKMLGKKGWNQVSALSYLCARQGALTGGCKSPTHPARGSVSGTARVSIARWNLEEAAGKTLA